MSSYGFLIPILPMIMMLIIAIGVIIKALAIIRQAENKTSK